MDCPKCHGLGWYPMHAEPVGSWKRVCDYCNGTGEVSCSEGTERQLPEKGDATD